MNPFSLELTVIDIQLGRDHCIRPYYDYIEVTGNRRVIKFGHAMGENWPELNDFDLRIGTFVEVARENALFESSFEPIILTKI